MRHIKICCILVSCNVAFYTFTPFIYYYFYPKEHVSLASFCALCVRFPNRASCLKSHLLLQKILPASSINKVDHSLVKIKPYNSYPSLNRQGRMQTSLARRPLAIQATYRYFLCSCDFVMTALCSLSS